MMGSTKKYIVMAVAALSLALVPFALADATTSVYGGEGGKTQQDLGVSSSPTTIVKSKTATISATSSSPSAGALPFTGTNLGFIAFAGIALVGVGVSLRRTKRDADR